MVLKKCKIVMSAKCCAFLFPVKNKCLVQATKVSWRQRNIECLFFFINPTRVTATLGTKCLTPYKNPTNCKWHISLKYHWKCHLAKVLFYYGVVWSAGCIYYLCLSFLLLCLFDLCPKPDTILLACMLLANTLIVDLWQSWPTSNPVHPVKGHIL